MRPEPAADSTDTAELLVTYLDFYRSEAVRKLTGLVDSALDATQVPSGWTPRQLLNHLVHMEQRWFVWGFLGEDVGDPWSDHGADGAWQADDPIDDLVDQLTAGGRRTSAILREHELTAPSATTGRFADQDDVPTLLAVAFHVLQEYARHVGHLDIVRELTDGLTGED
jgi:uncharacterized damage-inducible protein DinB